MNKEKECEELRKQIIEEIENSNASDDKLQKVYNILSKFVKTDYSKLEKAGFLTKKKRKYLQESLCESIECGISGILEEYVIERNGENIKLSETPGYTKLLEELTVTVTTMTEAVFTSTAKK